MLCTRIKCLRLGLPFALLVSVLLAACTQQASKSTGEDTPVIFPPPPAATRIQYLTQINSSEDLKGKRSGFHRYLFGEEEPLNIVKPYGVTVYKNKIYICDTGLGGLEIVDLSKGTFEYFIPGGKGQLQLPINCCVDEDGRIFVADANRKQIVVFDSAGVYLNAFGEPEQFKPTDVAVHRGKVWVANVLGHAVYVYDAVSFNFLGRVPEMEAGEEGFIRQSTNICLSGDILYVSDFGDFNIKRFTGNGEYVDVIGGYGNVPGTFTRPKGIATDREGNLYVVDAAFENVQIFNSSGELLMHFGGSYEGTGAMWLPASVEISYDNLAYFQPFVDESFDLKYLIFVTNQYGPVKVSVYGFVEDRSTHP